MTADKVDKIGGLERANILMLLAPHYLYINTLREYCESFDLYSNFHFHYASAAKTGGFDETIEIDFSEFDILMINYSVRIAFHESCIPINISNAIRLFSGYKILFIQDEYDRTEIARERINFYGINKVYTCVPQKFIDIVYPKEECRVTEFENILTGYIPPSLEMGQIIPTEQRPYDIVYRGREMPYVYGDLSREKIDIGKVVKEACLKRGLKEDIEWTENKRIYRSDWLKFLQFGKATLGTESGCNIFDMDGSLRETIESELEKNPGLTYEEAKKLYLKENNLGVQMNQISPKFFEFIASKTVLILFEGEYSGILKKDIHFLPLKKDFSNLEEIFQALENIPLLKKIADRAYADIVQTGYYSFKSIVKTIERALDLIPDKFFSKKKARLQNLGITPPKTFVRSSKAIGSTSIPEERITELQFSEHLVAHLRSKKGNFHGMMSRRKMKIKKMQSLISTYSTLESHEKNQGK